MTRRPLAVGLALAGVYGVVAVATLALSPRPLRPLFDGFAPPPPYNWVNPPPAQAYGNSPPRASQQELRLGPEGSAYANATPEDNQAIVSVEAGAVPPRPPDEVALLRVTPVDAGTLGPLPPGLRPEGNAYRITVTYQPSGTDVTALARPGTVGLVGAGRVEELLFSPDGRTWERRPSEALGQSHGLSTELTAAGYYLVASRATAEPGGSGGTHPALYVAVLALPPLALAGVALARRRRTGRPPSATRHAGSAPRPVSRGGPRPRPGARRSERRGGSGTPGTGGPAAPRR